MREWDAEIYVDKKWAQRLVGSQFSEFELCSPRLLGEGWDNTVWLFDEKWVFRFPRRGIAVPGIQREIEILPSMDPLLSLQIPHPVFCGVPTSDYPWPFFG